MPTLLRDVGEFPLIARLERILRGSGPPLPLGIGDDAAILPARGRGGLFTTDLLIEGVHFRREWTPPRALGWKALEASLSDIAAMGGRPTAFFLALSLPADLPLAEFEQMARGLRASAARARIPLAGGDTTASPGPLVISVGVLGRPAAARALRRDAARPGDLLAVSGPLGAAAAGLRLLSEGWRWREGGRIEGPERDPEARRQARAALRAHLTPRARLDVGAFAAGRGGSRAAIDLSDGLSSDLLHLCDRSGVGARVERARVPVAPCARYWARRWGVDSWSLAVGGGEDYELLLAVPPRKLAAWRSARGIAPPRIIGRVVSRREGVREVGAEGRERRWAAGGYRHFSGSGR
jgi:thiamine-monophosphate kinase